MEGIMSVNTNEITYSVKDFINISSKKIGFDIQWKFKGLNEVVIDKKYLSQKILNIFKKEPVLLDPWDPMGSLAK